MSNELAFVLINPYTIAKSRTGGVIARFISRTNLKLVGARIFGPSQKLVDEYANLIENARDGEPDKNKMIADYVRAQYAPNPVTGKRRRVMLLLFEGPDAVQKIWKATGSATLAFGSGETIRDTYGDYVVNEHGEVQYFEPAVLVGPCLDRVKASLKLWAKYSESDGGIIEAATDVPEGADVERTLVMLKPDNFRYASSRPGNIIDILSRSGLRIVGIKMFHMTVAQAEEFYGPVREALASKFVDIGSERAAQVLAREFKFNVPVECVKGACEAMAPLFANDQFEEIVKFITGYKPSECAGEDKARMGKESCLGLIYEGVNAVKIIRGLLGPTDPSKAEPGSVRREYGSDIMVNAAHASDSPENAEREIGIVRMAEDRIVPLVEQYFGAL